MNKAKAPKLSTKCRGGGVWRGACLLRSRDPETYLWCNLNIETANTFTNGI